VLTYSTDIGVLIIAALVSAALVLRFGIIGFVTGVIAVWALGIVRIELLYRFDPQRDAAMNDAAWVAVVGWIIGVLWCAPFLAGRLLFRWRRRHRVRHEPG
jgi:hypothetical protein